MLRTIATIDRRQQPINFRLWSVVGGLSSFYRIIHPRFPRNNILHPRDLTHLPFNSISASVLLTCETGSPLSRTR